MNEQKYFLNIVSPNKNSSPVHFSEWRLALLNVCSSRRKIFVCFVSFVSLVIFVRNPL
jgi:hypothetical protein